ncbi:MAG: hypothetical protein ACHQIL_12925 [Steroidobacterales bacterium]
MRNGLFAALLLLGAATGARADGDYLSPTQDRVRISLGLMQTGATTSFQLDSSTGNPGSNLDGEDMLGLDRRQTNPKFEAEIRAGERHRIRIDYFSLDRDDTKTLTGAPLAYGNTILLVGDPVHTDLSVRAFGLTYGYSFVHNDKVELAGTLGVSDMDINARLRVATATRHVDASHSIAGALPAPGIEATWVLSKRFYLDAHAQYLKASIDKLSGSFGVYEVNALYRLRPNVSFALGYSGVKPELSSRRTGQAGFADLDARGPQFLVRVAF